MAAAPNIPVAWRTCTSSISKIADCSAQSWDKSLDVLLASGMGRPLAIWATRYFEQRMDALGAQLNHIATENSDTVKKPREVIRAVWQDFERLREEAQNLEDQMLTQNLGIVRRFLLKGKVILESRVPRTFGTLVYHLLSETKSEQDCSPSASAPALMTQTSESHEVCVQLADLGFSKTVEDAVSRVVFESIDTLVNERTRDQLETKALPGLSDWVDRYVIPWITTVLPHPSMSATQTTPWRSTDRMDVENDGDSLHMRLWKKRISFHLHLSVGTIRIEQMLLLINSYPRSLNALEDLKDCIRSTDLKSEVMTALRDQFAEEMLNAGTMTSDILKQYVNMIRALRFLDSSDVILESVSDPIREYLRRRPDTVKCIVSDMTGDGELYEELERGRVRRAHKDTESGGDTLEQMNRAVREQDEDEYSSIDGDLDCDLLFDEERYRLWEPEPIDAPRNGKWRSGGDAITTLIAIYGSNEQIVNEYKALLADKLSTNVEIDIHREARVLSLLTERFGSETMHDCDIMLKDFASSIQIEKDMVPGARRQLKGFGTTIVSKEFWPKLTEEPAFTIMPQLERQMSVFEDSYRKLKKTRTLNWQRSVGAVSLTLEFDDERKIVVTVSPLQATILHHFGEQRRQSLQELQAKLGTNDETFVRRKVQGLANLGFLRAADSTNTVYETVEHGGDVNVATSGAGEDGEDSARDDADGEDGKGEDMEMAVYQSYVMAMLQNLKQLPLEQIHSMLQRFLQTPAYDKTEAHLAAFLSRLVAEGKVEVSAGMYRLKSKPKS